MPVKITRFQPVSMERLMELRRNKGRRAGDPGMEELLDAIESGEPQELPVEEGQNPRGMRIAIARAAGKRGLSIESYDSQDAQGNPTVIVVKGDDASKRQKAGQAQPSRNDRRRGRPKREDQGQPTESYYERKVRDGMSATME